MGDLSGFFHDNVESKKKRTEEENITVPITRDDSCIYCGRLPLDTEIKNTFSIAVCASCSRTELKFITKTKCMSDYLLTNDELRQFKYLSRPNPHKGTWNDMQLYLETQIIDFATEKYTDLSKIKEIKEKRKEKEKARKLEKVKKRVNELKKRTFLGKVKEKHVHKFVNKGKYSMCNCGMKIEEEEI